MTDITKVTVIGAGIMGSGLAAVMANAGLEVALLDVDRLRADRGLAAQVDSGGLDETTAARVRTGATGADAQLMADVDWIVEAAAENLDVKREIFRVVERARRDGSVVSSSTSTLLLSKLTDEMGARFTSDFLITHFFNPPRVMRLVEVVAGPSTRPGIVAQFAALAHRLGKSVVHAKDTPGFVANRIGIFWMLAGLHHAEAMKLDIEEADAVVGKPFGAPSGPFVFADLVGIDLLPSAFGTLQAALPASDPMNSYSAQPAGIKNLIEQGRIGRKSGAGFMRRRADGGFDAIDLSMGEYRPSLRVIPAALKDGGGDLRTILSHDSLAGRYAAEVICRTLSYAASLVPEIADSPDIVDQAMRDGYGWKEGPFQLIERLGADFIVDWLESHDRPIATLFREKASAGETE